MALSTSSRVLFGVFCLLFSRYSIALDVTEIGINGRANGAIDGALETYLVGPNFSNEVMAENRGQYGVFQGDIYVPLYSERSTRAAQIDPPIQNGSIQNGYKWPSNIMPYRFDVADGAVKQKIRQAMDDIERKTFVRFIELSASSNYHVLITDDILSDNTGRYGCYSYVGRRSDFFGQAGFQRLNIQRWDGSGTCSSKGIIIHELLHALGVWHEHTRPDRNSFVTIKYENIRPGNEVNFEIPTNASTVGSYDYSSIMHYSAYAFSKNNAKTIVTKTPGITIGQRVRMSGVDINTVNVMYPEENLPEIYRRKPVITPAVNLILE